MQLSEVGYKFISNEETPVDHAYQDQVGKWTCGIGHLMDPQPKHDDHGVILPSELERMQQFKLEEWQIARMFYADFAPIEEALNGHVHVGLTQNEFDALASLVFNIGVPRFVGSHCLVKLNEWDIGTLTRTAETSTGMCKEWMEFRKGGDPPKVLPVLVGRRYRELRMFLGIT